MTPRTVGYKVEPFVSGDIEVKATVGDVESKVIVLLVEVEAELFVPYKSTTREAAIEGITVPSEVAPVAFRVQVILSVVERIQDTFEAVPF